MVVRLTDDEGEVQTFFSRLKACINSIMVIRMLSAAKGLEQLFLGPFAATSGDGTDKS